MRARKRTRGLRFAKPNPSAPEAAVAARLPWRCAVAALVLCCGCPGAVPRLPWRHAARPSPLPQPGAGTGMCQPQRQPCWDARLGQAATEPRCDGTSRAVNVIM